MTDAALKKFTEKKQRIDAVSNLQTPDRVPFAPLTGYYPAWAYGISYYDIMMDPRNSIPGVLNYIEDLDPDMAIPPVTYCIPALEASGASYVRWPGPQFGIPKTSSFQVLDTTYLQDDEYDEFLSDPTHFQLTKILPRRHTALKGFAKLNFRTTSEYGVYDNFAMMTQPDVRESILAAIAAGEQTNLFNARLGQTYGAIVESGTPIFIESLAIAPYDMFSDDFRGLINTIMDIKERPEQLEEALEYMTMVCIEKALLDAKALNAKRVFIPLHAGVDEFMSPADYERFYWKGLKKMMLALIDAGCTPMPFCEGNYSTRLELLADVPKGKVQYMFEKSDTVRIKKIVGSVACIYGNFPNALLISGTKEQVADETKRMLDICAPGGGFIMNCGIALDNADPENMRVWRETTEVYGKY